MADEKTKYRNDLKELFKNYGLHRAIRSDSLNNLVDEINTYYKKKEKPLSKVIKELSELHEQNLKDQLDGWIEYLETEKLKLGSDSYQNQGIIEGFSIVIQKLKDVAKI